MRSGFKLGYLDDLSLGGDAEAVLHDMARIEELGSTLGISLNRPKCEYYPEANRNDRELENFRRRDRDELTLLGAPLFRGATLDETLQEHSETFNRVMKDLTDLPAHSALYCLDHALVHQK